MILKSHNIDNKITSVNEESLLIVIGKDFLEMEN